MMTATTALAFLPDLISRDKAVVGIMTKSENKKLGCEGYSKAIPLVLPLTLAVATLTVEVLLHTWASGALVTFLFIMESVPLYGEGMMRILKENILQ